jgi:hypothetical protein
MRNEAIVANSDQLTNERVRLNPAPLADGRSLLYLNEWSNECVISDCAPIEIDWLNYCDVFPKRYIDNPSLPNFRVCHKRVSLNELN